MQHVSDILLCSTTVTVIAQTSYFVSASYFNYEILLRLLLLLLLAVCSVTIYCCNC